MHLFLADNSIYFDRDAVWVVGSNKAKELCHKGQNLSLVRTNLRGN